MFGNSDSILVIVAGAAADKNGRPTQIANQHFPSAKQFMAKWGNGEAASEELDLVSLKELGKSDPEALKKKMAALTASLTSSQTKPKQALVVEAVCNWLREEREIVISETDPGENVHYVNPGDFTVTEMSIPNDGTQFIVSVSAPFG